MKHNHRKTLKIMAKIYSDLSKKYPRDVWIAAYQAQDTDTLSRLVDDIGERCITIKSMNQLNN
jgi:predicted translin family RNA/ssDNA-binding protein